MKNNVRSPWWTPTLASEGAEISSSLSHPSVSESSSSSTEISAAHSCVGLSCESHGGSKTKREEKKKVSDGELLAIPPRPDKHGSDKPG